MKSKLVIGVSGVNGPVIIKKIANVITPSNQKINIGFLITQAILEEKRRAHKKYVNLNHIGQLVQPHSLMNYIAHYCITKKKEAHQGFILHCDALFKSGCTGIQFNSPIWMNKRGVEIVQERHPSSTLILQINELLLKEIKYNLNELVTRINGYGNSIDGVLLDMSSGKGKALSFKALRPYAEIIRKDCSTKIGIAGGLTSRKAEEYQEFINAYNIDFIDAEQGLMSSAGRLSIPKVLSYIQAFSPKNPVSP